MRSWGRSSGGLPACSRLHSCGGGPGINSRSALLRLCEHIPSKPGVRGWASGKASPQLHYDRLLAPYASCIPSRLRSRAVSHLLCVHPTGRSSSQRRS